MEIIFSGEIDIVATYAAILSTLIAFWEFIKWKNRNAIKLTCTPSMVLIPSYDKKTYILTKAVNQGNTPTTITHYLGHYWPSRFHKIFRWREQAFIVKDAKVPTLVSPGEEWIGTVPQEEELEKMAREGLLYMGISHSMSKKPVLRRVKISKKNTGSTGTSREEK